MKKTIRLSGQSLLNGVGHTAILVILLLAAAALFSPVRNHYQLRRAIDDARHRVSDLEVLYPLYAEVMAMDKPADWRGLPLPSLAHLSEPEVVHVPDRFTAIARSSEFELSAIRPQVRTDSAGERYLRVDVRGHGAYDQLKNFLVRMAESPVLKRIQKIEVRRETRQEELHMIADLALD